MFSDWLNRDFKKSLLSLKCPCFERPGYYPLRLAPVQVILVNKWKYIEPWQTAITDDINNSNISYEPDNDEGMKLQCHLALSFRLNFKSDIKQSRLFCHVFMDIFLGGSLDHFTMHCGAHLDRALKFYTADCDFVTKIRGSVCRQSCLVSIKNCCSASSCT